MSMENKNQADWLENIPKIDFKKYQTKGYHHLWNYFEEITRKNVFVVRVKEIREEYKIPPKGYNWSEEGAAVFQIPSSWPYIDNKRVTNKFDKEIREICNKFGLFGELWEAVVMEYVFWNEVIGFWAYSPGFDLCFLEDYWFKKGNKNNKRKMKKMYPVVLRISSYASGKEIIDFIKKKSEFIKAEQKKYINPQIKIKEIRKKNPIVQKRNDYIYLLYQMGLPIKDVFKLTMRRFGDSPDEGAIGKIISLERKKRK